MENTSESDYEVNMDNVKVTEYRAREEDLGEVVKFVQWHYIWTHPDYPGAEVTSGFMTELPDASSENFIDLDDVTTDTLKQWVVAVETENGTFNKIFGHVMEQMPLEYKLSQTVAYIVE